MKTSSLLLGAASAAFLMAMAGVASAQSWADSTTVSGRMYYDLSDISNKVDGTKSGTNGTGFDITRFYVGIDHKFTDMFSGNITTDFQYNSTIGATEVYLKKAYLQATFSPEFSVRAGATDMPWIPYAESIYGYRYVDKTMTDKQGFGTSSDWGLHALGTFGVPADGNTLSYQVSVVNGNGYKNPTRAKNMDVEGRVSAVVGYQWNFAIGGYTGKLGKDVVGASPAVMHTAHRVDALAAWVGDHGRLGVEYFSANDWKNVTSVAEDKADGYSVFGTYRFNHDYQMFGRVDDVKPSKTAAPTKKDKFYNVGLTYSAFKNVDFSLVAKHDDITSTGHKTTNDEVGVFAQFQY